MSLWKNKISMKKPEFPAINVSKNWDKNEDVLAYILLDEYIGRNDRFYKDYYFYNLFVDCNGEIFKITDRILPTGIRDFFSFLPGVGNAKLVFEQTGRTMTIEEIRSHLLKQAENYDKDNVTIKWINNIREAKTIEEMLWSC